MKTVWVFFVLLIGACAPKPANVQPSSPAQIQSSQPLRDSLKPISEVLANHTASWVSIPGVTGTGEGQNDGKPAIVIFVDVLTDSLRSKLPTNADGYEVVIKESGSVHARFSK